MPDIVTIEAYGHSYQIQDPGGIIGKCLNTGEPYEAKALHHVYRKGLDGLAVDVGASVGNHALFFAAVCGLRVVAFEPLDFERLEANVVLNPGLDIQVHPIGLGDVVGRTEVVGPPAHVVGAPVASDGRVQVACLDDFGFTDVALLKIDVEGMEPEVLRGAKETISHDRPVILAEAQDGGARDRNAAELEPLGYRRHQTFGATPLDEWLPE